MQEHLQATRISFLSERFHRQPASPIQDSVVNHGVDEDCFNEDHLIEVQLFNFIEGGAVFRSSSSRSVRGRLRTHIACVLGAFGSF